MFERYIGLDMSITSTGIVILSQGGAHKQFITVQPKGINGENDLDKFRYLASNILSFCRPTKNDLIIVEDYAFGAKGQITRIAEMGGIAKFLLYTKSGIRVEHIVRASPTTLKKFALGKGNGKKNMMMLGVYKKWGFDAPNDDVNDAFVAARLGLAMGTSPDLLLKYELECVKATLKKNKLTGLPAPM